MQRTVRAHSVTGFELQATFTCFKLWARSIQLAPELIWYPKLRVVNRLNEFESIDERINQAEIDYTGNLT